MLQEIVNSEIMMVLAFLVLLQLQMTWSYTTSAFEVVGNTILNTDAAVVTSAIQLSIPRYMVIHINTHNFLFI